MSVDHRSLASGALLMDGSDGTYERRTIELSLFDINKDPGETTNVLQEHPEVAGRLQELAEQHRKPFHDQGL
jgi:arylsulfatase A